MTKTALPLVITAAVRQPRDDGRDARSFGRLVRGDRDALADLYDAHAGSLFRHGSCQRYFYTGATMIAGPPSSCTALLKSASLSHPGARHCVAQFEAIDHVHAAHDAAERGEVAFVVGLGGVAERITRATGIESG